ncbi:MAG: FkbM family methyltransferase [Patescibacteria group bacterium]
MSIKKFLKFRLPTAVRAYHSVRLLLLSYIHHPFSSSVFVEETDIKIPIHNPHVYGLCIGGGRVHKGRLYYEEELVRVARESCRGKKVFFDVGAHIGYWSYVASSWGMQVAAFEPKKELTKVIEKTARRENLSIITEPHGNAMDEFVERTGLRPDFIKIDVDGAEDAIIAGARRILERYRPGLMIEVRKETMGLLDDIQKLGYKETQRTGEDNVCVFFTSTQRGARDTNRT